MCLRDPTQRLAAQLLALAEAVGRRQGNSVLAPRLSHEALADMLGLRRETVTLHLARLRRMGILRVEGDRFRLQTDALAALKEGHAATGG